MINTEREKKSNIFSPKNKTFAHRVQDSNQFHNSRNYPAHSDGCYSETQDKSITNI